MKKEAPLPMAPSRFAEVILPIAVPTPLTYRIPDTLTSRIAVGQRVIVPLGKKKITTGIVARLHDHAGMTSRPLKDVLDVADDGVTVNAQQFTLYTWMADYYMCTLGETLSAALPAGLRVSGKRMARIHPSLEGKTIDDAPFSPRERLVLQRLQRAPANYADIAELLDIKSVYRILRSLSEKRAIVLFEEIREKYRPKTERCVRLSSPFAQPEQLELLFEKITKKPRQEQLILQYLQETPVLSRPESNAEGMRRANLIKKGKGSSSLAALLRQGVFEEFVRVVPRYGVPEAPVAALPPLTPLQLAARDRIWQYLEEKTAVLLQGVTGSGKTEIYIDLINRVLKKGRQVLYLIPEIALTTQMVRRLRKTVQAPVGVYHSGFSDSERVEMWRAIQEGKFSFIVGTRSSVLLPFSDLGLIVVDEEHDASYKQYDPAPRYNARDVALVLGRQRRAGVLLGSATPSAESYFHALSHRYEHVVVDERFNAIALPSIVLADLRKEARTHLGRKMFSSRLLKEIEQALQNNEQVLLFQNRRGYAPIAHCEACGWTPSCANCAVHLTYHKFDHKMICHYCGYKAPLPGQCPDCGSPRVLTRGYGTERLAEELSLIFEEATVRRMDRDATRTRGQYAAIIDAFEKGRIHILVGTQMITKGLDFSRVSLVGIFDADRMRYFPDFRSHERTFQLITQAAGRAGRKNKQGLVVVQTFDPAHALFDYLCRHDTEGFMLRELRDRKDHAYPPYVRLIVITVKHAHAAPCLATARDLVHHLKAHIPALAVLGPGEPMVARIKNQYLRTVLIKIPRQEKNPQPIKEKIRHVAQTLLATVDHRSSRIVFDVDPM